VDDLAAEELVLTLLRSALVADALPNDPPDASRRSAVSLAGSAAAVPSLRSQPPAQARSRSETRACGFQ
jgi:hypothetical protein